MRKGEDMRKIHIVAFSICLASFIIAGFPRYSAADVIYGCYDQLAGLLRVVPDADPANCTCFETPIQWNSEGPVGPAATVSVGSVTTGEPGTPAAVTNSGTSSAAVFNFTIPQGQTGAEGPEGPQGLTGPQGPAGVANGVTRAVHGLYSYSDTVVNGTIVGNGFYIRRFLSTGEDTPIDNQTEIGQGRFRIWFNNPFTAFPTCVVTVAYPNAGGQTCSVAVNSGFFNAQCYTTSIVSGALTYTPNDPNGFFFMCVE